MVQPIEPGTTGAVNNWIEFSAVDGPGNRFTVFLQGCNFDCLACHNPYTIALCNDCGECVETCPTSALTIVGGIVNWDASRCAGGDECLRVCPYDSTPKARTLTVASMLDRIRMAAPFLSGITVSGGEPTQQPGFVGMLFAAVKDDPATWHLSCFVDSNGAATPETWDQLDPVMDAAMIDLKALDAAVHRRLTGHGNAEVLESIRLLAARGKLYEVRLLLSSGANDADDALRATGAWLAAIDPTMRIRINGYRHHGVRPVAAALLEPTVADMERYAKILSSIAELRVTALN